MKRVTESKLKNPCYDEETGTDCTKRHVGCHETCNRWKIYTTLKAVERKQRIKKKHDSAAVYDAYQSERSARIRKIKRWDKR